MKSMFLLGRALTRTVGLALLLGTVACGGAGGGCGSDYPYPRTDTSAAPTPGAARLRVTQSGLDEIARGLPAVLAASCDEPVATATGACAVDDVANPKVVYFFVGSPTSPMSAPINVAGTDLAEITVRAGEEYEFDDEYDGAWGSELADRPYCDDVGGAACRAMKQRGLGTSGQGFCRDPDTASGCNNPASDYCCGNVAPNLCNGPAVASCNAPRARIGIHLDSLGKNSRMRLIEDSEGGAVQFIAGCDPGNLALCNQEDAILASADMVVGLDLGILGDAACALHDDPTQQASMALKSFSFTMRPRIGLDATGRPIFEVQEDSLVIDAFEFDFFDMDIVEAWDDPKCYDENWNAFAYNSPWGQFTDCTTYCITSWDESWLSTLFSGFISESLAQMLADAVIQSLAGTAFEAVGELDLKQIVPVVSRVAKPVPYLAAAHGDSFEVTGTRNDGTGAGFNVDLNVGFTSKHSPCVPEYPIPRFQLAAPPELGSTVRAPDPVTGVLRDEPFDLALVLSDVLLNRAAFNLFNAGALCLDLDAEEIGALGGGSFAPSIAALSLIAPGMTGLGPDEATVDMVISPRTPPIFRFGTGQGSGATRDSTFQLEWLNVGVDLYPLVDDGHLRALSVAADIDIRMTLVATPTGDIEVFIDKLGVQNVTENYNEIGIAFDAEGIASIIETFLPALLSNNAIDVPLNADALGVPFVPKLRAVERLGTTGAFMAIYLSFCTDDELADPANALCHPPAESQGNSVDFEAFAAEGAPVTLASGATRPTLRVQTTSTRPEQLEVAYRVDDAGPYFGFAALRTTGEVVLDHPLMNLPGLHRVTLIAREAHRPAVWTEPFEVVVAAPARAQTDATARPSLDTQPTAVVRALPDAGAAGQGCAATGSGAEALLGFVAVVAWAARSRRR